MIAICPECGSTNIYEHNVQSVHIKVRHWEDFRPAEYTEDRLTSTMCDGTPLYWCRDCDQDFDEPVFYAEHSDIGRETA